MASQTSDTANGPLPLPPTAGLPADPLPLLLKVTPVVPSPPKGCGTAPAACMPHPRPASGLCCPGSQLHPRDGSGGATVHSPQCLQEFKAKPRWDPPPTLLLGVSGKEPSYLSPRLVFPAGRSPLALARGPCAGAMMCCISTNAGTGFADSHLGASCVAP